MRRNSRPATSAASTTGTRCTTRCALAARQSLQDSEGHPGNQLRWLVASVVALFSSTNWSGDEIDFVQTTGWANLANYGWNNRMQSWANQKTCSDFLADGNSGGGDVLTLGAGAFQLNAGAWKNKASSANVDSMF